MKPIIRICFLLVLAAVLAGCAHSFPWPKDLPKYSYIQNGNIVIMKDSEKVREIAIPRSLYGYPAYSPDGTKVALVSHDEVYRFNIYVANVNDGEFKLLTTTSLLSEFTRIEFSPDSTKLMIIENQKKISISDLEGNSTITPLELDSADWNPTDNQLVAGTRWIPNDPTGKAEFGIFLLDGTPIAILDNSSQTNTFAWNNSGDRLAYEKNHMIWVVNKDGTYAHPISEMMTDLYPSKWQWSPSGLFLAYVKTVERDGYRPISFIEYINTQDGKTIYMGFGNNMSWLSDTVLVLEGNGYISVENTETENTLQTQKNSHHFQVIPSS